MKTLKNHVLRWKNNRKRRVGACFIRWKTLVAGKYYFVTSKAYPGSSRATWGPTIRILNISAKNF